MKTIIENTTLYCGNCIDILKTFSDKSINCCVTSPPYWGLRDYGTATWEGGDSECNHQPPDEAGKTDKPTSGQRQHAGRFSGPNCYKCGAIRIDDQLGLETTPEEYVEKIVNVFREVKRVLRDDGTLWLNLGDSYCGGGRAGKNRAYKKRHKNFGSVQDMSTYTDPSKIPVGLKPKDLVGIPWRVAFALQSGFSTCLNCALELRTDLWPIWNGHKVCINCLNAGKNAGENAGVNKNQIVQTEPGWYLRSDIIWSKPAPMPESVTDRPTKAHEYIFLLSKKKKYYYDHEAIKEDAVCQNDRSIKKKRNKRTVWTITTKPFKGAHFAVFPPDLIEPCILAGCPEGGVVLDPFGGSGTVGVVAKKHNRKAILCDLNSEYIEMATNRLK